MVASTFFFRISAASCGLASAYSRPLSSAPENRLTISGFSFAICAEVISTLP